MRKKQIKNIRPERRARAPYNFVPLPEKVFIPGYDSPPPWERNDQFVQGTYSGFFEIEIKAETHLYIRCCPPADKINPEDPKKNPERQNFFHHGDPLRPVIPGSTLRGMIRTLVEILSYSKLQWFNDMRFLYRSVASNDSLAQLYKSFFIGEIEDGIMEYPSSRVRAGYLWLKNNKKYIRPAKTINGHNFVRIPISLSVPKEFYIKPPSAPKIIGKGKSRRKLFIVSNKEDISKSEKPGFEKVRLVQTGPMPKKRHHYAFYEPDPDARLIPIPEELWELYEKDKKIPEKDKKIPRSKTPLTISKTGDPLFYLTDENENLIFFGPAMMFRIPYKYSIKDFVPEELRDPNITDLAEAIFGVIKENSKEKNKRPVQIKGRVYFEDCLCTDRGEHLFLDVKSPKILSTPKPTTFQHYLIQDSDNEKELKHWNFFAETEIRGYKLYWHKPKVKESDIFEPEPVYDPEDTQHTIIRPVKLGTTFRGKIHFDNLTDLELGALICALQLPEDKRHHLGMGKPLGMGSVKITAKLNLIDRKKRYERLFDEQGNTELGLIDENQTQQIAENCLKTFKEKIIQHCLKSGEINNKVSDIWDIPRIAELGVLLKWNPQISQSSLEEISYQSLPKFKKRPILPNPAQVENILLNPNSTNLNKDSIKHSPKPINYKPSLKRGSRRLPSSQKKSKSKK